MDHDLRTWRTMVVFHAHPDDEALLTAGTMARAVHEGCRVVWVIATDGGLGVTRPPQDEAALGRVRRGEAEEVARVLGVSRLVHLGYADSGADAAVPADPPGRSRFVRAPLGEAAGRLADLLVEEQADVLVTDDRDGGYGHRDHVHAHRVGVTAAQRAATPQLLEATLPLAYTSPRRITHCIDVRRHLPAKRAALQAHRSQSSRAAGGDPALVRCQRLPRPVFGWFFGREWFIGRPAPFRRAGRWNAPGR